MPAVSVTIGPLTLHFETAVPEIAALVSHVFDGYLSAKKPTHHVFLTWVDTSAEIAGQLFIANPSCGSMLSADSTAHVELSRGLNQGVLGSRDAVLHATRHLLEHWMLDAEGFFVHAASTRIMGLGILCPGRSRAGKSTFSSLIGEAYSDDGSLVYRESGIWKTAKTPFLSDFAGKQIAEPCQLRFLLKLEKEPIARLEALTEQRALALVLEQLTKFERTTAEWNRLFGLCSEYVARQRLYLFYYPPQLQSVQFLMQKLDPHTNPEG